jgi:hypothetical protein
MALMSRAAVRIIANGWMDDLTAGAEAGDAAAADLDCAPSWRS